MGLPLAGYLKSVTFEGPVYVAGCAVSMNASVFTSLILRGERTSHNSYGSELSAYALQIELKSGLLERADTAYK